MMSFLVRKANIDDVDFIVNELKLFDDIYSIKHSFFKSYEYIKEKVTGMITSDMYLFLVSVRDGIKTGFISGMFINHIYNDDIKVLLEMVFWVNPKYRNGRSGFNLLKEFVKEGKSKCNWITFTTVDNKTNISERSLSKFGFIKKENNFLIEV